MPTKDQSVGVDDYYAHVNTPTAASSEEKKGGLKLKIKPKIATKEGGEASSVAGAASTEQKVAETPHKEEVAPRKEMERPSFPTARVVSRAPQQSGDNRPRENSGFRPRENASGQNSGGQNARPSRPEGQRNGQFGGQNRTGNRPSGQQSRPEGNRNHDNNRPNNQQPRPTEGNRPAFDRSSFEKKERPSKPFVPRISFEAPKPTEIISHSPVSEFDADVTVAPTKNVVAGAKKLAEYSASHKNVSGRGKNTSDRHGKGDDRNFGGKKNIKVRGADDINKGGFRRSGKMQVMTKKEKNIEEMKQILVDKTGQEVAIPDILTVKEFSEKIGIPLPKIIAELMKNGMRITINTKIDFDTCYLIGESFGVIISREQNVNISASSLLDGNVEELLKNDDVSKRITRAPIISIMGHVDHGKTSILDYIRKTTVASGEAGGITQKIGAYQVERNGAKITFLDTPGHEAFSIMRSRGAKLTDLAVIVIAADEGMKPQTIESINHAKSADVSIIVAVNKMDKPGANLELIYGQLSEQGLQPEAWGGSTVVVPVSAHTGLGIETLLDMIVLFTDLMELTADPNRNALGTVIESHLDQKMGPLSTVLINAGTLRKGDYVVCANAHGRVRALRDFKGKNLDEAGPSLPVQIVGLSKVVEGGDILQMVVDSETAATKAHEYELLKSTKSVRNFEGASLDMLMSRLKTGSLKQLKIVLKCDSNGSLEALKNALMKLSTSETQVAIIHSGVGDINDSDVLMAGTSQALLIAYNVSINVNARSTLANSKIEFIDKKVIYHILEKVENIITGMVDLKHEELELGSGVVKAIFYNGKDKLIVGLGITSGKIENRAKIRIVRDSKKAGSGEVLNLKSGPIDVHEIEEGGDCGISFKGDTKLEEGDILEFYKMVLRK